MTVLMREIQSHWVVVHPLLTVRDEREYDLAVERLNSLLDEIGTDERHPLYGLLDTLGTLIRVYEEEHYSILQISGAEMVRHFMEEYDLAQSDLPEVGSQGVVSEVLNGKRELNVRQIRALAKRFRVSPAVFM